MKTVWTNHGTGATVRQLLAALDEFYKLTIARKNLHLLAVANGLEYRTNLALIDPDNTVNTNTELELRDIKNIEICF